MHFTKMEGAGNDYVYVDLFKEKVDDPSSLAKAVSDRHFGIGSDGLILIGPSEKADFTMDMYNADGSRGKMCGNGIRCVGKYVYDHGLTDKDTVTVETLSGIKELKLMVEEGKAAGARVDMGAASFEPADLPADTAYFGGYEGGPLAGAALEAGGKEYKVWCVSMGNPHCVTFLESAEAVEGFKLDEIGPLFEKHAAFPEGVNAEFAAVFSENKIRMRVYERGSAETMACGTGACATAAAAVAAGLCSWPVEIVLNGGTLTIDQSEEGHILMTGPAREAFEGEWKD